ncbi:MAG: phenylalanine--tRNA ligase subunit beta [Candidatus Omnitrophota bacterium]|jgi:phenylalanyl-tRNA synthetase beta chain
MKVTYNWLKEFVNIKVTPQELSRKLTMAGLEVVSLEEKDGDFIFEIEVTSNRPDWLSVKGIAREAAAILGLKLKEQPGSAVKPKIRNSAEEKLDIKIEDKKDCPLYCAKIIQDVKVRPSPEWMRKRLELIGCRSVNNIVDITNYVLFETGQPLHAFDLDKISGKTIFVRRAKEGERLVTIDAQEKKLNREILVIADEKKILALAGVMGGKDTEVTSLTKNILLGAAVFEPVLIRRSRKSVGLDSDSSYRFERGINVKGVELSSLRASNLIEELTAGKAVLEKSSKYVFSDAKTITLDANKVFRVLGQNIPQPKIKQILQLLDFKVKRGAGGKITVTAPSSRRDIILEEDLIEEVARIYGFELIKEELPAVKPQVAFDKTREVVAFIKDILTGLGLSEAITYSLIDRQLLKNFNIDDSLCVEVLNPLSREQEVLRPTLIPSLSRIIAYNLNQKQDYVYIFEAAKRFIQGSDKPKEELMLAMAVCGTKPMLLNQGLVKDESGILNLKGAIETVLQKLGIQEYSFENKAGKVCVSAHGEDIGSAMQLDGGALETLDIKNKAVFAAEISLEKLTPHLNTEKKFEALPRYPGISRDISLILKENISIRDIINCMRETGGVLLRKVEVADYYRGKQIPAGFRGLTLSCLYRSDERTLTESEINPVHAEVLAILVTRFGVKTR